MFGVMETELSLDLDRVVHVDGDAFLQVLRSLPAGMLELRASDSSLAWRCGTARGQLAAMVGTEVPEVPWPADIKLAEVGSGFSRGLDLGSIACGTTALMSVGLFGVSIDSGDSGPRACASDNNTMSTASLGSAGRFGAQMVTLAPTSARVVSALCQRPKASVASDDTTVFCQTPDTKLVVKQVPQLKFSVREIISAYMDQTVTVGLKRDVVTSFLRRAEALTEEKGRTSVAISVSSGQVRLQFAEGKASSEEYYLAEGVPSAEVAPISVDVRRMARALAHAATIVFDYAPRGALVLRGDGDFAFVISGRATATPAQEEQKA